MALAWGIKKPFLCTNIGSRTQPKLETPTKLAQPSKQQQRILIQVCKRYLWSLLSGYKSSYVAGTWVSSQAQSHASVQTTRTLDPLVVPLSEPTGSRSFPCSCTVNYWHTSFPATRIRHNLCQHIHQGFSSCTTDSTPISLKVARGLSVCRH